MYDELIKRLHQRIALTNAGSPLQDDLQKAANAIEELQKRVPPVPHGRLIDADALEYHADNVRDPMGRTEKTVMWKKIESAQTILPAEGVE